ncbi:hypothetical protein OG555_14590 [Kribbella sp. NBC_01484]|uniref:hypothetical protein n=1 Tax=Kribbella sp. NBC_01484 TaxID=2903579 RepID=UPI002E32E379|nr:hypothetical protein [Kribbella sp. NBC_01484]
MSGLQRRPLLGHGSHSVTGRAGCKLDDPGALGHIEAAEEGALNTGQRADDDATRRLIINVKMRERRSLIVREQPTAFAIDCDRHDHVLWREPRQSGDQSGLESMARIVLLEPHQSLDGRIAADHGPEAGPVRNRLAADPATMLGEATTNPSICGLRPLW